MGPIFFALADFDGPRRRGFAMAMAEIKVHEGALRVGDERVPFVCGEVHYWRLNPHRWAGILERVRALGVEMVATYVPWQYHELAPGRFDFTGESEPQRSLTGFLDLLGSRGFRVFIRPGPYIYAEWRNAGVPDRVAPMHRLGAEYRREAEVWMRAVCRVIGPHLATRGGPIVLFQPDNEFDLFSHWFEDPAGLSGVDAGLFQRFLREAYAGDIHALNDAWGTDYAHFEAVQGFAEPAHGTDPHERCRARDYWRFQHWATAEGVRWHAETYRALGIDVPMIANYYPGGDVQNWRVLHQRGGVDALGIDWYPRGEFGAGNPGSLPPATEQRRMLDSCRYQRVVSPLPCIAELECGVWHGYHEYVGSLGAGHYRLMLATALMAGIKGFNWYMLVGRDNWYYTPINENGEPRPELAAGLMELHRVVRALEPWSLEKVTGAAAVLDPEQFGTDGTLAENDVLRAMHEAGADFEVYDPELGRIEKPLLFYAGADWLPRESQARLLAAVERGAMLVLFRARPVLDERFRAHNGLELIEPDRVLSRLGKKVEIGFHRPSAVGDQHPAEPAGASPGPDVVGTGEGAVWSWDEATLARAGAEPIWGTQVAGRQQAVECADAWMRGYIGRRFLCGYRRAHGRGRIVQIGLPANADLVRAVHACTGTPLPVQAGVPDVIGTLFRRGGSHYVVATNMNDATVQTRMRLNGAELGRVRVQDLFAGSEWSGDDLVVDIPGRSGGVWRVDPA